MNIPSGHCQNIEGNLLDKGQQLLFLTQSDLWHHLQGETMLNAGMSSAGMSNVIKVLEC
jgi:hypothetical protein